MLIVDLDDTLFETRSIAPSTFKPALEPIERFGKAHYSADLFQKMVEDLWSYPFDLVAGKYGIPLAIQDEFYKILATMNYQLNINPFNDYKALKEIDRRKILVTTGVRKLQEAKIDSLEIESDFEAIFIDDPKDEARKHKIGWFRDIIGRYRSSPSEIWVIGDNPEAELKAGKTLGMRTVQRLKQHGTRADTADHAIRTFFELKAIIEE